MTRSHVVKGTFGESEGTELRCSFCWKPRSAVRHLISGPGQGPSRPLICNECVDLCAEIIAEEDEERPPTPPLSDEP
jgi:ATP-dependent Clp protease ATP-binding subunit ClpX